MKPTRLIALITCVQLVAADLPVRQVILYKHGVGFFEREGTLANGESARLDFRESEMNDVLKSLTIQEKGGGKISSVRYDADLSLEYRLNDFPFKLGDHEPLATVLDQLKGSRIEMTFGGERVAGAIVAARLIAGDKERAEREQVTLLVDNGDLRNFDLSAAGSVHFSDAKLKDQFRDYLAALTAARSTDRRTVYIDSTDAKSRAVAASYLIPTPIWKSSYRLILDASGQPMLEGWAIVDNTTGEDWTNVRLSLVSGKPISFISQLYPPRNVPRQTADLPELAALAPVVYQGAMGPVNGVGDAKKEAGQFVAPASIPMGEQEVMVRHGKTAQAFEKDLDLLSGRPTSVANTASGREAADLFEYSIPTPVTVKKNGSAMLPFLQQKIASRKLLIYSDRNTVNPLNSAELTNTTGMTLDGGPITVYDSGVYAGEALMETLKATDKRLISYGVDLGTRITTDFDSKSEVVRELHATHGVLTSKVSRVETTTYKVHNVDAKAKTLYVEMPSEDGVTVVSPKPVEITAHNWRFQADVGAKADVTLPVVMERVYSQTYQVSSFDNDQVMTWARNKALSADGRRKLEQLAALQNQLTSVTADAASTAAEITTVSEDQQRTRDNLQSLNRITGQQDQVQIYARQLAALETRIAKLRDQKAAQDRQQRSLEAQVKDVIEKMTF